MSEQVQFDDPLPCDVRVEENLDIKQIIDQSGNFTHCAVYNYRTCGFKAGYDFLLSLW